APSQPQAWRWSAELAVRELRLDWWYRQFAWAGPGALSGTLDFALTARGRGAESVTGAGRLALADVGLALAAPMMAAAGEGSGRFERLALSWEFARDERGLALDVANVELLQADGRIDDGSFSLRTGGEDYPLQFAAARLPLATAARLAHLLPVDVNAAARPVALLAAAREHVLRLQPRGNLHELIVGVDTTAEPVRFRLATRF